MSCARSVRVSASYKEANKEDDHEDLDDPHPVPSCDGSRGERGGESESGHERRRNAKAR